LTRRIGRPPRADTALAAEQMVTYDIPEAAFRAYCDQLHNCHNLGTTMELTLKQWWDWWQENNRWAARGRGANSIMMLRRDMTRGFSLDNIYPGTAADRRRQSEAARTLTEAMASARAAFGQRPAARMAQRDTHPKRRPCQARKARSSRAYPSPPKRPGSISQRSGAGARTALTAGASSRNSASGRCSRRR
jgi:hypothetical protein